MKYQATGEAINMAISVSFKKSFDSKPTILVMLAPNTFLTAWDIRTPDAYNADALRVIHPVLENEVSVHRISRDATSALLAVPSRGIVIFQLAPSFAATSSTVAG